MKSHLTRTRNRTHGLSFESSDSLQLSRHIVINSLELLEDLLSLSNNALVLEDTSVVLEVDVTGGALQLGVVELCERRGDV